MQTILVRKANMKDVAWVNAMYKEIDFEPSRFENEFIVIAEIENEKCGLGRLVTIDPTNIELGGIYVLEAYRGMGIAEKIVRALCEHPDNMGRPVWCLPFTNLLSFYKKFGFSEYEHDSIGIPPKIKEKYQWCNSNYRQPVLLLRK